MEPQWPESPAEKTEVLTPINAVSGDEPTVVIRPDSPEKEQAKRRKLRRAVIIGGAVVGVLAVLYGLDLLLSNGAVPRGVTVAGVDVGGSAHADAERTLRDELGPRLKNPVAVRVGDVDGKVDPAAASLSVDWAATLDKAGDQPLNPITRITSFFTTREVGVVSNADDAKLTAAIEALRPSTDREPAEGTIRFDGLNPVPVDPKPGQKLDAAGARTTLLSNWANGKAVQLPAKITKVKTTKEGVRKAVEELAKPAVAAPVVLHCEGADATLTPETIAATLVFQPAPKGGGLTWTVDQDAIVATLQPQIASTEVEGKDATIVFEGGAPAVQPSVDGKGVDWGVSLTPLMDTLKKKDGRELTATYTNKPAKVTTEAAEGLGIKEVIGEFTTNNFAADSGINIRTVAAEVNGAIVKPGEEFSLNGFTGPRTTAEGYVEAGVIKDGAPGREVGGGISQFATTLYNASYFAAMGDAGHKEHSYYISRYPPAREATVFQNHDGSSVIDLKFKNDTKFGVAIQTIWTPSSITVKLWGTKQFTVESIPGTRTNEVAPAPKQGPAENCHASNGAPGFTTTDTRVIRDAGTGAEVSRKTRTVKYNPQPIIVCAA